MYYLFLVIHLLIALLLGVVVLLQRSKGNGLAGAFGGVGAGEAMFGSHGVTTMLHKATIYLAIGFMITSLSLVVMTSRRSGTNPDGSPAPVRNTGQVVLPVGGDEVAAPQQPVGTSAEDTTDGIVPAEGTADDIVPAETPQDDSIVPAPNSQKEDAATGTKESGTSSGSVGDTGSTEEEGGR
jgi:protein translocase SecG subunit